MFLSPRQTCCAGFAFTIYFCLGFFGAARWGASTQGDLLQNVWGPGPYQGTLNTLLGIYLAFTMPPICYPTAHVVKARTPILIQPNYKTLKAMYLTFTIFFLQPNCSYCQGAAPDA